jgi:hypothetical protein
MRSRRGREVRSGLAVVGALAAAAAASACQTNDSAREGSLRPLPPSGDPTAAPLPDPEREGGHVGRAPRRITVAQLRESIRVATGREWRGLNAVAASLGQADYAFVNAESTEANLVFAKFLEDGAREVCMAAAGADNRQPVAASRVLSREVPDGIGRLTDIDDQSAKRNLLYLSTRFWGSPLADAELDDWLRTFKAAAARAEAIGRREQAWAAMCIALMTDPRFITY